MTTDRSEVEGKINELFEELVPDMGNAKTVAGEIIRATCKIVYRWYNDGDCIDRSYGKETLNAPARYLCTVCKGEVSDYIQNILWGEDYDEEELLEFQRLVLVHIENHPELKTTDNKLDMYDDFQRESDTWYSEDEDDDYEWEDPFAYDSDDEDY